MGGEIQKQEAFLFEESAVARTENESHVGRGDINHFSSSSCPKPQGLPAAVSILNQAHMEYSTGSLCQRARESLTINTPLI